MPRSTRCDVLYYTYPPWLESTCQSLFFHGENSQNSLDPTLREFSVLSTFRSVVYELLLSDRIDLHSVSSWSWTPSHSLADSNISLWLPCLVSHCDPLPWKHFNSLCTDSLWLLKEPQGVYMYIGRNNLIQYLHLAFWASYTLLTSAIQL